MLDSIKHWVAIGGVVVGWLCVTPNADVTVRLGCIPACADTGVWGWIRMPPMVTSVWVKLFSALAAYWGIWKPVPVRTSTALIGVYWFSSECAC